jgi:cysteine synthase
MSESNMPGVLLEGASLIDERITVTNDEAFDAVRRLA